MVLFPFCSSCVGHCCEATGGAGNFQPWGDMGKNLQVDQRKKNKSEMVNIIVTSLLLLNFLPCTLLVLWNAHKINVQVVIK